ncbi:hypothetical protein ACHQM5_020251 [Ranunculus cassubicifolius]
MQLERQLITDNKNVYPTTEQSGDFIFEELHNKIESLKKELEDKESELEDLESLNQILILKENTTNRELQDARKELINGLQNYLINPSGIGIKQVGEVNKDPFMKACFGKFQGEESEYRALGLMTSWQHEIGDPNWHPFKRITIFGKTQEVVDIYDEKLVRLKEEWGGEVYEAVISALKEMNDHNASGRYVFPELWNFDENRMASLKEVVHCILQLLVEIFTHKRQR